MDNVQKSERVIAIILSTLMERGIQRGLIDLTELVDADLEPFVETSFHWLLNEGIVTASNSQGTKDSFAVVNPSLTSLGFELMGLPVKIDGSEKKLATFVQEVSKDRKSYSQFGDFFGGILGGLTKSLGS